MGYHPAHMTEPELAPAGKSRIRRPQDARAVRSREALRGALLLLVEAKPFEQIAIKEITERAGVSYPVFFRQFSSKEELLEDVAAGEVRNLLSRTNTALISQNIEQNLFEMCDYVNQRRTLWTTLLTGGAASVMRAEFTRISNDIRESRERANPWLPAELATAFVVNGLFEILSWWLRQPDNYPIGNVVKLIDVLIVRSTMQPVDIELE